LFFTSAPSRKSVIDVPAPQEGTLEKITANSAEIIRILPPGMESASDQTGAETGGACHLFSVFSSTYG
jgi:hypothetical protein